MEHLADAYLAWKYPTDKTALAESDVVPDYDFTIHVVDIYTRETHVTIHRTESSKSVATAMVHQGYLGTTPEQPSLALSIRTLELYYRIRRRKPSFSIEAFAKVLCDIYTVRSSFDTSSRLKLQQIPYHRRYRDGLSNAFDVYLAILRIIDKRVAKELGRDGENWRVLNACPPCSNVLEDEPQLRFSRMFVVDGNNSLKRVGLPGDRQVGDARVFKDSDYYISNDFVNLFADEVKKSRPPASDNPILEPTNDQDDGDLDFVPDPSAENASAGDPTDGLSAHTPCADNWKAAENNSNKKMWAIFDESGIFASACRHGFVLWITDMIRSGEL
ncbi:hypothetical protein C0992_010286 [Termitomyces sp. T32_za158]|nr:hypothetical protein C0992_010286 [Termitomyces sp. T32_za158]